MMRRRLMRFFDTSHYTNSLDRERANIVYSLDILIIVLTALFVLFVRNEQNLPIWEEAASDPTWFLAILFLMLAAFVSLLLTRTGRITPASMILTLATACLLGLPLIRDGLYTMPQGLFLVVIVLVSGLLLRYRGLALGLTLTVAILILGIANRSNVPPPPAYNGVVSFLNAFFMLAAISTITFLFLRLTHLSLLEGASSTNAERLKLAQITSQVAQHISHRTALKDVLSSAVEQICHEYPYIYHAQIFLLDPTRKHAQLVASTGEVGHLLLERQHYLAVGSQSVIGQVTAHQQPLIARAGSSDHIHHRNEFLPDTVVEAAVPLCIGDTVIGALDLQSKMVTAFHPEDMPFFQSLADHLAIAIDNARLFEETERRLAENQQLVERSRQAVEEVERLNQQLTGRYWMEFLGNKTGQLALDVDFEQQQLLREVNWTPTLQEAIQNNHLVQQRQADKQVVAVPLHVRGQVIGAMEFELESSNQLSPEEVNLIAEVGERLSLAAETNRLFEASQRFAQREALVNEIATRLQVSNTVEMTLNAAARSLKDTLKAGRVAIRLGTPPANSRAKGTDRS